MIRRVLALVAVVALSPLAAADVPPSNITTYYFGVLVRGPQRSPERHPWPVERVILPDPLDGKGK